MKQTKKKQEDKIRQFTNGDYIKIRYISPMLIDQVQASVRDPDPPLVRLDTGEDYPNTQDPGYLRQLSDNEALRNRLSLHALVVHGMTLCDEDGNPIDPPNDGWEFRLRMSGIDWKKEVEKVAGPLKEKEEIAFARMIAYIMFVAVTMDEMDEIMNLAGVSEEEQRKAAEMFRSQEE